ncbi:MAG TPA: helix-turn-helix domain-containing protein [Devosiaceae bacterium]
MPRNTIPRGAIRAPRGSRTSGKKRRGTGLSIHRSYTPGELARALGVTTGTVLRWRKEGLTFIMDGRPYLVSGADALAFLKARRAPRRKCQMHECLCFRCQDLRAPALGMADYVPITPTTGMFKALCEVCNTVMNKRIALRSLPLLEGIIELRIQQGLPTLDETR